MIRCKDIWCLKLRVKYTISQDLFHHFLFRGLSIGTPNIIGPGHLGNWFAIFKLRALHSKCLCLVWCTRLGNNIPILCEISVHVWPSTLATFGQVVAVEEELRGKLVDLLSVL